MPVATRQTALEVLQDAAAATGDGTSLAMQGYDSALLGITGTFSATITFEATIDDTVWVAVALTPVAGGAVTSTATAPGLFKTPADLAALSQLRARVSTFGSGTITVKARKAVR